MDETMRGVQGTDAKGQFAGVGPLFVRLDLVSSQVACRQPCPACRTRGRGENRPTKMTSTINERNEPLGQRHFEEVWSEIENNQIVEHWR